MNKIFEPKATYTVAASTTSAEITTLDATENQMRIHNPTTSTCYIAFGTTAQTATASSMPIGPGATEVFTKANATRIAVLLSAGTGAISVTTGSGW
jgi:hypothetical protein